VATQPPSKPTDSLPLPPEVTAADLTRALGQGVSDDLALLEDGLVALMRKGQLPVRVIQDMVRAIVEVRHQVKLAQQAGRVMAGRLRQSHEQVSIKAVLEAAIKERQVAMTAAGVSMNLKLKPVEVLVDPGMLVGLIDASLDWAQSQGNMISVSLGLKNWPKNGILTFEVRQAVMDRTVKQHDQEQTVAWHLLRATAYAMGVGLDHSQTGSSELLRMEFSRTVNEVAGLSLVEIDSGPDSGHSDAQMAGMRLLLIAEDLKLVTEVKQVARNMGLILDVVPNSRRAEKFCELELPHLILLDERKKDSFFDDLRDDILRQNSFFPFVEISGDAQTFEMSGWEAESVSRLGIGSIKSYLPQILTFELARAI
jgi:hypothetical protein